MLYIVSKDLRCNIEVAVNSVCATPTCSHPMVNKQVTFFDFDWNKAFTSQFYNDWNKPPVLHISQFDTSSLTQYLIVSKPLNLISTETK